MGMMIRLLFPLIGYVAVATVITMAAGYGYLRHTGNLDNERMFQIISLLHGIDTDKIAEVASAMGVTLDGVEILHEPLHRNAARKAGCAPVSTASRLSMLLSRTAFRRIAATRAGVRHRQAPPAQGATARTLGHGR